MKTTIQQNGTWRLDVERADTPHGTSVRFLTYVPSARRPEEQVKLQLTLTREELQRLQKFFHNAVAAATI